MLSEIERATNWQMCLLRNLPEFTHQCWNVTLVARSFLESFLESLRSLDWSVKVCL